VTERLYSADFERFFVRHFGARGRVWLDQLPARVERYARLWQFELEHHLAGGLMSCCLAVMTSDATAAVFKLDGPWTPASRRSPHPPCEGGSQHHRCCEATQSAAHCSSSASSRA